MRSSLPWPTTGVRGEPTGIAPGYEADWKELWPSTHRGNQRYRGTHSDDFNEAAHSGERLSALGPRKDIIMVRDPYGTTWV